MVAVGPSVHGATISSCVDYSFLVRFGCDPGGTINAGMAWVSYTLASLIQAHWPLLTVAAVLALTVGAVLAVVHRRRREHDAQHARFVEIIPPYQLPAEGAVPMWRLLASTLSEHRGRARVALVVYADRDDGRVHAGLWMPGGVSAQAISQALVRAWPGCSLAPAEPPSLPEGPAAACEVVPAEGPWAPLVDHQHRDKPRVAEFADEPLRAALQAVTDIAASGGFAAFQVIVSPAPATRIGSTLRSRSVGGWIGLGLRLLARGFLSIVDIFLPGSSSAGSSSPSTHTGQPAQTATPQDAVAAARQRAREAKRQAGPHLRATVRLAVAGTVTRRGARRQARGLAAALAGLSTDEHVTARKRVRHVAGKVGEYRHGRTFLASTRELAALWHLPQSPARYGLPQPGVEHRKPDSDLPRLDEHRDHRDRRDPQWRERRRRDRRARDQRREQRRRRRDDNGHGGDENAA